VQLLCFSIRITATGPRFDGNFPGVPVFNASVVLTSGWPTAKFNLKRAYVAKLQGKWPAGLPHSATQELFFFLCFGQQSLILQGKG